MYLVYINKQHVALENLLPKQPNKTCGTLGGCFGLKIEIDRPERKGSPNSKVLLDINNCRFPSFNDFAHIPWEDTPNFPKPPKRKNSFINCWWNIRGTFQGYVGEILESWISGRYTYIWEMCSFDGLELKWTKIISTRWFKVTFLSLIVGGHLTFPKGHVFTIPKRAAAELPGRSGRNWANEKTWLVGLADYTGMWGLSLTTSTFMRCQKQMISEQLNGTKFLPTGGRSLSLESFQLFFFCEKNRCSTKS